MILVPGGLTETANGIEVGSSILQGLPLSLAMMTKWM
jgi:hypothetical protein